MVDVEVAPWLKALPLAPEFHPTEAEFADPIAYIFKIEAEARQYGICKIVPPLPKAPKKTVIANLNRSLAQSLDAVPTVVHGSATGIARSMSGSVGPPQLNKNRGAMLDDSGGDGEMKAKFATRRQQLGWSAKRSRGQVQSLAQKLVWQSGESYTLEQFEAKAKQFARSRLGTAKDLSPLIIETLFWKAADDKPITIEYGNDIPGSAFGETCQCDSVSCQSSRSGKKRRRDPSSNLPSDESTVEPPRSTSGQASQEDAHLRREPNPVNREEHTGDKEDLEDSEHQRTRTVEMVLNSGSVKVPMLTKGFESSVRTELGGEGLRIKVTGVDAGTEREGGAGWKLANSPWNMRIVARSPGSLLRHMPDEVPGVTSPMVYVGMLFSWFAWHVEDHELHSLNYLHMGAPKTWYAVPGDVAPALEEVVRVHGYGNHLNTRAAFALLGEKTTVMSPEVLIATGVPCCRLVQNAGEFVVTFPRAYHLGFSHGFNCGEAANFATPGWLEVAKEAATRRAAMNYLPMLSHQQLLYLLALSFPSRIPVSLPSEPRSSRLKDRKRSLGEEIVKTVFVNDVAQNNRLLGLLVDMGVSCCLLLKDDAHSTRKGSFSDIRDSLKLPCTAGADKVMDCSNVQVTQNLCIPARDGLPNNKISIIESPQGFHVGDSAENTESSLVTSLPIDWGTLPCAACGLLCFASMAVVQPVLSDAVTLGPLFNHNDNTLVCMSDKMAARYETGMDYVSSSIDPVLSSISGLPPSCMEPFSDAVLSGNLEGIQRDHINNTKNGEWVLRDTSPLSHIPVSNEAIRKVNTLQPSTAKALPQVYPGTEKIDHPCTHEFDNLIHNKPVLSAPASGMSVSVTANGTLANGDCWAMQNLCSERDCLHLSIDQMATKDAVSCLEGTFDTPVFSTKLINAEGTKNGGGNMPSHDGKHFCTRTIKTVKDPEATRLTMMKTSECTCKIVSTGSNVDVSMTCGVSGCGSLSNVVDKFDSQSSVQTGALLDGLLAETVKTASALPSLVVQNQTSKTEDLQFLQGPDSFTSFDRSKSFLSGTSCSDSEMFVVENVTIGPCNVKRQDENHTNSVAAFPSLSVLELLAATYEDGSDSENDEGDTMADNEDFPLRMCPDVMFSSLEDEVGFTVDAPWLNLGSIQNFNDGNPVTVAEREDCLSEPDLRNLIPLKDLNKVFICKEVLLQDSDSRFQVREYSSKFSLNSDVEATEQSFCKLEDKISEETKSDTVSSLRIEPSSCTNGDCIIRFRNNQSLHSLMQSDVHPEVFSATTDFQENPRSSSDIILSTESCRNIPTSANIESLNTGQRVKEEGGITDKFLNHDHSSLNVAVGREGGVIAAECTGEIAQFIWEAPKIGACRSNMILTKSEVILGEQGEENEAPGKSVMEGSFSLDTKNMEKNHGKVMPAHKLLPLTDATCNLSEETAVSEFRGACVEMVAPNNEEILQQKCAASLSSKSVVRPRLLCLEHALEAQHQLKQLGGSQVVIICHSSFIIIEERAKELARELGVEYNWRTIPFKKAKQEERELVRVALDIEEDGEQGCRDWIVQLGMSVRHSPRSRHCLSENVHSMFTNNLSSRSVSFSMNDGDSDSIICNKGKCKAAAQIYGLKSFGVTPNAGKSSKQKKIQAAGRWCGKVWMNNQVHPVLGGCHNTQLTLQPLYPLFSSFQPPMVVSLDNSRPRGRPRKQAVLNADVKLFSEVNIKKASSQEVSLGSENVMIISRSQSKQDLYTTHAAEFGEEQAEQTDLSIVDVGSIPESEGGLINNKMGKKRKHLETTNSLTQAEISSSFLQENLDNRKRREFEAGYHSNLELNDMAHLMISHCKHHMCSASIGTVEDSTRAVFNGRCNPLTKAQIEEAANHSEVKNGGNRHFYNSPNSRSIRNNQSCMSSSPTCVTNLKETTTRVWLDVPIACTSTFQSVVSQAKISSDETLAQNAATSKSLLQTNCLDLDVEGLPSKASMQADSYFCGNLQRRACSVFDGQAHHGTKMQDFLKLQDSSEMHELEAVSCMLEPTEICLTDETPDVLESSAACGSCISFSLKRKSGEGFETSTHLSKKLKDSYEGQFEKTKGLENDFLMQKCKLSAGNHEIGATYSCEREFWPRFDNLETGQQISTSQARQMRYVEGLTLDNPQKVTDHIYVLPCHNCKTSFENYEQPKSPLGAGQVHLAYIPTLQKSEFHIDMPSIVNFCRNSYDTQRDLENLPGGHSDSSSESAQWRLLNAVNALPGKPAGKTRSKRKKQPGWKNGIKVLPNSPTEGTDSSDTDMGKEHIAEESLHASTGKVRQKKLESIKQGAYHTRLSAGGPSTRLRTRIATKACKAEEEDVAEDEETEHCAVTSTKKTLRQRKKAKKTLVSKDAGEAGAYPCDIEGCIMSFATKQELNMHKRNTCTFSGCGKRFCSHKYLLQHRRVHMDERPLKCLWKGCKMTFKWAWARTEHYRVHTGERPYKCPVPGCGQTFRFVSDFSRHKRNTGHTKQ